MTGEAFSEPRIADVVALPIGGCGVPAVEEAVRLLVDVVLRLPLQQGRDGVLVDIVVGGARCIVTSPVARPADRLGSGPGAATERDLASLLSPREQEIARMVGTGYTNKEIATVLDISSWTVSTHLRRIFGKLDVGTRAAMVARLMASGGPPG